MNDTEKKAPGFMIYNETAQTFLIMNNAAAGIVIKAAREYYLNGTLPEFDARNENEKTASIIFSFVRQAIDRGQAGYEAKVEGGRKGARKRYGTSS